MDHMAPAGGASPPPPPPPLLLLLLVCVSNAAWATTVGDTDYGGVPLWVDRRLGEPSVLTLRGRLDPAWLRANSPGSCPAPCGCPAHWPTAVYCEDRGLGGLPERLPPATQYLFLQGNNISSLSSSKLTNVTGLRWLILDHNRLDVEGLDPAALRNQTQLRYLFINHNVLGSVPAGLPPGLRELRLAHNRIGAVSPGAFRDLAHLTLLLLQGNRIRTLTEGDLRGLTRLSLLDLGHNRLSAVPPHLPASLEQLYLSNNSLSRLDADTFARLQKLKYLRLSGCGLGSGGLPPGVFNLSSLVELDLSYNKLTTIPTVPSSLQYLYLEANQIQEFRLSSLCREVGPASYSRMKVLRLDGNKLLYHQLPPDWIFCLRVLQNIYI